MRSIINSALSLLLFTLIVCSGCDSLPAEPELENPLDEENPDYIAPETFIVSGPAEGSTVTTHSVTFTCSGNEHVVQWAYQLNDQDISAWQSDSVITLEYLDEGLQELSVWGRYATGDTDPTPATRSFTLDAITGPALWLSPRKVLITSSEEFTLTLIGEDLVDMLAFKARIAFNTSDLEYNTLAIIDESTSFLKQNEGDIISIIDTLDGILEINILVVGGTAQGLSGSGELLSLTFENATSNSSEILILEGSTLVNTDMESDILEESYRLGSLIDVGQ